MSVWDYVLSAYTVDADDNRINGNGDLRCPGCPLGDGYAGLPCLLGSMQQDQCVVYIQDTGLEDEATRELVEWRAKNEAAILTSSDAGWLSAESYYGLDLFSTSLSDGDVEARDPDIGPGLGDPDYVP
jgi:hypothetical protein